MKPQSTTPRVSPARRIAAVALVLTLFPLAAAVRADGGILGIPGPPPSTAYAALWLQAEGEARIEWRSTLGSLLVENAALEQQGFRLVDLEIAGQPQEQRFVGLWHEVPAGEEGPSGAAHVAADLPLAGLSTVVAAEADDGYRIADIEVYRAGTQVLAAAVFHPSPAPRIFAVGATEDELLEAKAALEPGYQLIDLELFGDPCGIRYAAVWAKQTVLPGPVVGVAQSWRSIVDLGGGLSAGHHLADLELAPLGENASWLAAGLWQYSPVPEFVLFPATWGEIEDRLENPFASPPGPENWLLSDLEILWHYEGEIPESTLTLAHDGPMIPPSGD